MKKDNIPNINYLWSELIVEELFRNGIRHICISPGSRSTPITLAAARHKGIKKTVHFDERGLAFFAVGVSAATKEPVALISTSGTAVANFFPALIEASKKKLPLIFFTADRPPELRKTGSLQTIDQPGIFGKYVRWATDLPVPDKEIKNEFVLTTVDQAVFMSKNPVPGPVHINCMFREPLAPEISGDITEEMTMTEKRWVNNRYPFTTYFQKSEGTDPKMVKEVSKIIGKTKAGIIVVGKLKNKREARDIIKLSEHLNWPLFGDIVSGTRNIRGKNTIKNWDLLLLHKNLFKEKLDTVLHLGGRITSKRWYDFIKNNRPEKYITIINHPLKNDPLHVVSHRINLSPGEFAKSIIKKTDTGDPSQLLNFLIKLSNKTEKIVEEFVNNSKKIDEIFIAREISKLIFPGGSLFLGNSMPVRDMDIFYNGGNKDILWGGNRGSSGIDGNIASATGFCVGSGRQTTLIIGDIAALHDLNSLYLTSNSGSSINIILINNNGGGIFSFLPIAGFNDNFEEYFSTPHNLKFQKAAEMFGFEYSRVVDKFELKSKYEKAIKNGKNNLIEVVIDMETNVRSHRELMNKLEEFYNISRGENTNE